MKKLLTLLFILISLKGISQTTQAVSQQIANEVPPLITRQLNIAFANADTVTYLQSTRSGGFNFDTIRIANNTAKQFELVLTGMGTISNVSAMLEIWISNRNGVYNVFRSPALISFAGLTGGGISLSTSTNGVIVKITGTSEVINWSLKKQ